MSQHDTKRKLEEVEDTPNEKRHKPNTPVKVLVCGDVKGQFHTLFSKINELNAGKSGPFDVLFCVGKFFCEGEDNVSGAIDQDSDEYKGAVDQKSMDFITGRAGIDIPTYFVDGASGSDILERIQDGGKLCHNLTFLGRRGITDVLGLKVAYMSGIMDTLLYHSKSVPTVQNYCDEDVKYLEQEVDQQKLQGKIDILLTSEWPQNILQHVQQEQFSDLSRFRNIGATAIAKLAKKCAARYHFSALEGFFFERPPYTTTVNDRPTCTRFLALAPISDSKEKSAKYLYAAKMLPVDVMDDEQLSTIPPNATPSPFEESKAKPQQHGSKRGRGKRYVPQQRQPIGDTSQCWFCLSNPQVEKHLIASIGDESYLVLPKGALVPEHVLIVPLAHFSSLAVASQQTVDEIGKYITALKTLFKDKKVIIFERNIKLSKVSTHMHLQVVPIDKEVPDEDCYNVFENDARNVLGDQIEVRRFAPEVDLQSAIIEAGFAESQYLLAEMPDGGKIIHEIPEHFIKQTLAMGRRPCSVLLNAPEREDWRSCALSVDEEKKLTASFKTNFKPLDFTN